MSTAVAKRESAELVEGAQGRQLEAIKRILSQRTPTGEIRVRDGRGGQKLKYTDGAYVIRTLNEALGWDWDFVADSEELLTNNGQPFEVKVRGTLTVRMDGRVVTKTQYGCQPIEMKRDGTAPVSIGDCYKGAATDAMKKCASLLGIALDLYDSDSAVHGGGSNGGSHSEAGQRQAGNQRHAIVAFAEDALKWTAEQLIAEIHQRYGIAIEPAHLGAGLESMPGAQLKELDQALKAELQGRNRTK